MNKMGIIATTVIAISIFVLLIAYTNECAARESNKTYEVPETDIEEEVLGVEYTTEEYRGALQNVTTLSVVEKAYPVDEDLPLASAVQIEVQKMCEKYDVDYALILAIMDRETGGTFNTEIDKSRDHVGAMQVSTYWFKKKAEELDLDIYDELDAIELGISYMRDLLERYEGEPALAVMAYNMGEGKAIELYRKGYVNKYTESIMRSRDIYEARITKED